MQHLVWMAEIVGVAGLTVAVCALAMWILCDPHPHRHRHSPPPAVGLQDEIDSFRAELDRHLEKKRRRR